ncbi:MAG TPA: SDR family oxidoreductase [Gaiellaceae bacterium]|nr:SDR family oxidoreductase [Gaiellaceae bacterium]
MPSRKALVTGGGRGIGETIARALAADGWSVSVTGRTRTQVEQVAESIGGQALVGDVSKAADVRRWVGEAGDIDLLVCNAGVSGPPEPLPRPDEWWRTFEVNVLGVFLCCHAFAPAMQRRRSGRIVNVASGSAYLPARERQPTAYGASKAALHRFSELLAQNLAPDNVFVFSISPGLVQTEMTAGFPEDMPWTPPERAPALVLALASGEFDTLAGRYLHAEHDPPDRLRERAAEILERDLNAVRLRRD